MSTAPVNAAALPATCIIVQQMGWTFQASVVQKRTVMRQQWCKNVAELARCINDEQLLRKGGPVYQKLGQSFSYVPLSYEQAVELEKAELL